MGPELLDPFSARVVFPFTVTRMGSFVGHAATATIAVHDSFSLPCIGI
jgi:hypothetical protein